MIDWNHISLKDLAAYVSEELRKRKINAVLVGGACVTIYSQNRYQSYDLDFATFEDLTSIKKAMKEMGFQTKGRHFIRNDCPWIVEFVSAPIAVGDQPIHEFKELTTKLGTIQMLRPEDSVKDRLASYFHWNDRQSLEQAISICLEISIDLNEIEKWSIREKNKPKFDEFIQKLKKTKT